MQIFVSVVDAGSFSGAARNLNLSNGAISLAVQKLEDQLQARLLNRSTRRVSLTEDGETYFNHCVSLLSEMQKMDASLARTRDRPQGRLRADMPVVFGRTHFIPALPRFMATYPDIKLVITMADRREPLKEGVDVAVHHGPVRDASLIAHRVHEAQFVACASPAFIAAHGEPSSPKDLKNFRCLNFLVPVKEYPVPWRFERRGEKHTFRPDTPAYFDSADALIEAALAGAGIIYLMEATLGDTLLTGKLVPLLRGWNSPLIPISVVYPKSEHLSPKVLVFRDFVVEIFATRIRRARFGRYR